MLTALKNFYKKTRNIKIEEVIPEPVPITHTHVFHKEYPRLSSIELPRYDSGDNCLQSLLEMRKSTRNFSDRGISLTDIAKILDSCRIVDQNRTPERRTYPSGGARFPVELYLIAFNIENLVKGAYHYNIKKQKLELLLQENLSNKKREFISPYLENPAATILFTTVIARSEVKYGLRAYPYSLIEAGHMGQNIHLTCTELGIGSCPVSGFIDDAVKEILDLSDEEIPIYSMSVGWEKK